MRILIVDFEFPEPDRSSGGHRLFEIVKILAAEHEVAFLSWDYWWKWHDQSPRYEKALNELGVRTCFVKNASIDEATGKFIAGFMPDVAILSKYYIANIFHSYLRSAMPSCKTILDTVDVHHVRERRQEETTGQPNSHRETEIQELAAARMADQVWVITPEDAKHFACDTVVVPNIHPAIGVEIKSREGRKGIVFVGNYIHQPNVDAVWYLSRMVVPKLREMGIGEPVIAAGAATEQLGEPQGDIEHAGWVEDLNGFLSSSLVGVAPLRYGSGMKGKVGSYMSCGLPVVSTSIGAEGMGLENWKDVIIADNASVMAEAVAMLIRDRILWERISSRGAKKVTEWTPESVGKVILEAVSL